MLTSGPAAAPPRTPVDLAAEVQAGGPTLVEALTSDLAPRAWRLAHALTGDAQAAQAVIQEAIGNLLAGRDAADSTCPLVVLVYRLTVAATLARMAAEGGTQGDPIEDWLPAFDASGHRVGDRMSLEADWSAAPGGEAREACTRVREATRRLPLDHRLVLVLRDGESLTEGETAEVLGVSRASVRARLHRARMALRERLSVDAPVRP